MVNQWQKKPKHTQKTIKHIVSEHSSSVGRVANKRETVRWVKGTSLRGRAWSPVYGKRTNRSSLELDALSRERPETLASHDQVTTYDEGDACRTTAPYRPRQDSAAHLATSVEPAGFANTPWSNDAKTDRPCTAPVSIAFERNCPPHKKRPEGGLRSCGRPSADGLE